MSTPLILHRLYSLDTSSPNFLRDLHSLIQYDEKEQYLTNLQGSELARLVDFLDEVRALPLTFCPAIKWIPQTLSAIPITDDVARECLNKLQAICGHHATLPSSYIVSGQITRMGDSPVKFSTIADVWAGTYHNKKVSIKCLRIHTKDHHTLKVCIWIGTSLSRLLNSICGRCSHSSRRPPYGQG